MNIGPLFIHRKEQWDLGCWPWLCVHQRYDQGNGCRRIFCVWGGGIQIGPWRRTWGLS
jgi:hypothetical protein